MVGLIEYYSEVYGVDAELTKRIVKCESGFVLEAKNPNSSAEGYFQFINSTWIHTMELMNYPTTTSKFDPEISVEAGVFLLAKEGVGHWSESRWCWDK